jgi:hypothetical protein
MPDRLSATTEDYSDLLAGNTTSPNLGVESLFHLGDVVG